MKVRILSVLILIVALSILASVAVVAQERPPERRHQDHAAASSAASLTINRPTSEVNLAVPQATSSSTDTWWSGGPVGAAVNAIAIDPLISNTIYVATAGGGLYRSTDGGDTWDDTPNDPVQGLDLGQGDDWVFDVATAEGVVYAAAWGWEWFHWSTDGGETWSHTDGGPLWAEDLEVHPTVTTTIYAAELGVWKSTTGGQSWVESSPAIAEYEWITEIAINPITPTTVYAASDHGKVYRTTDGAAHWNDSSTGLPGQIVWSVAVNPLTSTIVYAGLEAEGVWRSDDGGDNWSQWSGGDICPYVRDIVVDPSDPDTVYIGTDCSGVYKRSEGDTSWTHLGPFYTSGQRRVYAIGMTDNAPGTVFAGIWGDGIYRSTNGGQDWEARNVNLSAMAINRIATDPTHRGTAYATAYGGLFRTTDAGQTWERIRDTHSPAPLYASAFALAIEEPTGKVYVGMYSGSLITTTDGVHWSDASNGLSTDCGVWDIAINPVTSTTVYAAQTWCSDERGVYRSQDGGENWELASSGLTYTWVTSLAVDPHSPEIVYAGTRNGDLFRSANGGDSWAFSGGGIIPEAGARVMDICPDANSPGIVYLAQSNAGMSGPGGIYRSTDYGVTWQRVLEGHDPQALLIDPLNPAVLITASWNDYLYRSEDGGDNWSIYDADAFMGYRYTKALVMGRTGSGWRLYAGTGTNSVWQRDIHRSVFIPLVLKNH